MDAPALHLFPGENSDRCLARGDAPLRVRGVAWVLCWAATLAVLAMSATVLSAMTCRLAVEQSLAQAAAAGLRESSLPRATRHSVESVMRERLAGSIHLQRLVTIEVRQHDRPIRGYLDRSADGRTSVTLAVPESTTLPRWLRPVLPWLADTDSLITAQIDGRTASPSRPLRPLGL